MDGLNPGKYLGEKVVEATETPFAAFTVADWALYFIGSYGQIDGDHHKLWTLDQVARILNGAPITIKRASWSSGYIEHRVTVGTCKQYKDWVKEMRKGEDGPETYDYDAGIPP